jgi:hypothetical protein
MSSKKEGWGPGGSAGEDDGGVAHIQFLAASEGAAGSSGSGQETGGCNKRSGGDSEGGGSTGSSRRSTGQPERLDHRGGLVGPLPTALRVCVRLSQTA